MSEQGAPMGVTYKPPLVVDTDPGIDDALALIYLMALGRWDVKAVTAVAGNVELDQAFDNAGRLLALLGSEAPLRAGCPKPLLRELQTATEIHGSGGLGSVTLPATTAPARNEHGVAAIDRLARDHEGRLTVLTLGPLTNLAAGLILDPGTSRRIRRVVSMVGAARVPGNVTSTAEFNAYVDPEALKIVADSGVDWCMVGLDVTHQALFTSDDLARLEGDQPAVTCARDLLRSYLELSGGRPCALHDPLAAAVVCDPAWVVTERGRIQVRTDEPGRGTTVFAAAPQTEWDASLCEVATAMARPGFVDHFIHVLTQGPSVAGESR